MSSPRETFDAALDNLIAQVSRFDLQEEDTTTAMRNLETFSKCRPPDPILEPTPEPVPMTTWEKVKAEVSGVWDNETTRVFIKAGGAFAGVALVVWSTVHRDHVVDRQALTQANQRVV